MSLFQKSVINKYLKTLDSVEVEKSFLKFKEFYGNSARLENIRLLKEENYQEGFLREIFVQVLGYTINPDENYNLTTEFKNLTDAKKADGAILDDGKAIGVIELKSTKTSSLESINEQAFNYKNHQPNCRYIITSNFEKIRFYIDNATDFEEFNLFTLSEDDFKILYLILSKESIFNEIPIKLKKESVFHEENISKQLYRDYSQFKRKIFKNLVKNNPQFDKLTLFKKSQKLLDRFLFILFGEDSGLVPPNTVSIIIDQWKALEELDEAVSLYSRFLKFFHHLDIGHKYKTFEVPAYNGGLFREDKILNTVQIDDEILLNDSLKLSLYDFQTEIDVNILGHIFENSLNEIEELTAELEGKAVDKKKTKRKKEGVYYTPKYITKYIVENTVGKLCNQKKIELKFDEIDISIIQDSRTKQGKLNRKAVDLLRRLKTYSDYLLSLKILDPACGSGAFLNQALEFLIEEHQFVDEYRRELEKDSLGLFDIKKSILENNIYGVDINEESVEIAKLSLWLRTAERGRKLSDLSNNIKCGNSLIDDPEVAGEKAFKWEDEFPDIMANGGFDVVIGNPPYVQSHSISNSEKDFYYSAYNSAEYQINTYSLFVEKTIQVLKNNCFYSLIIPNYWLSTKFDSNLRKMVFLNNNAISVLNTCNVFEDATVDTLILTGIKTDNSIFPKSTRLISVQNNLPTINERLFAIGNKKYSFDKNVSFNESLSDVEISFNDSFHLECRYSLKDFFSMYQGMKPYEKGKGIPKQTREMMNEKIYHSFHKIDDSYFPLLKARSVQRNLLVWENDWIKYGPNLAAARKRFIFEGERILVNRILSKERIDAVYLSDTYINNTDIFNLIPKNSEINIKAYYAIIVSNLCADYFRKKNINLNRNAFPKINVNNLESFPVPEIDNPTQERLTYFVDSNLHFNKNLFEKSSKFLRRLTTDFNTIKISKKLSKFYLSDFSVFISELTKQKIKLSLIEKDEWQEYFDSYKNQILDLSNEIKIIDDEIDSLVFKIYGLEKVIKCSE